MPYAIVQNSLDPPSVEQLAQAFTALPSLTDTDAATMARDAFGILVGGLELADAGRLLQALHAAGVDAEMVDEKSLPPLPPAKPCRRAEPLDDAFVAYDHLSRATSFEWPQVVLLAAGAVRLSEWRHSTEERVVGHAVGGGGLGPGSGYEATPITRTVHKDSEQQVRKPILDVFLSDAPGRYRIDPERFNFGYLGERAQHSRARNYVALVRDCVARATGAILNRGAYTIGQDPTATFDYRSKHAFEEESVWLLWRHFVWRDPAV